MAFLFENLKVYQMSHNLADEVTSFTESFPKGKFYLADQLNRAVLSIPNNIAEGNGRYHKNDRKHFFHISRGSAYECVCLLDMCRKKGLIKEEAFGRHKSNLDEICKMLMGLINGLDK